jgi:hypothetical protein
VFFKYFLFIFHDFNQTFVRLVLFWHAANFYRRKFAFQFYQIKSIVRGIYVILYTFREVNDILW